MFPAHAGMNRKRWALRWTIWHVPRCRKDEGVCAALAQTAVIAKDNTGIVDDAGQVPVRKT